MILPKECLVCGKEIKIEEKNILGNETIISYAKPYLFFSEQDVCMHCIKKFHLHLIGSSKKFFDENKRG